jgi:hypothetical protein
MLENFPAMLETSTSTIPAMLENFPAMLETSTSIVDVDVPALLEDSTGPKIFVLFYFFFILWCKL